MAEDHRELSPYRVLRDPISDAASFGPSDIAGTEGAHLRDYWRVVAKHRTLVLAVLLVAVASTAIVSFTMDPLYTATATIQIERQAPKMAPVQEVQQVDGSGYDIRYDYYETQFEIMQSRSIAARVIRSLGLDGDPRFLGGGREQGVIGAAIGWVLSLPGRLAARGDKSEQPDPSGIDPALISHYLGMLSVDPVRNSRLVRISFTSRFKDLSAEVANDHVEQYTNALLEQRLGMTANAKEFLEIELAKSKDRLTAAEAGLNHFRKTRGVISLDGDKSDIVSDRLEDLNKRFTEAQADRIQFESQYQLIQRRDYQSLPDVLANGLVAQLKQEASRIEGERAELEKKFKPGYPKLREVIGREEQVKARLDTEVRGIVQGIESAYLAAKGREEQFATQLEMQRQAALSQKDVSADYATFKREVETAQDLYSSLLQRLKDIDVAEEIKVSNVSMVDPAVPPLFASSPKKKLNLLLATIVGSMLGVGIAFFLEYLDNTVKTPEDVAQRLGLPTLGVVPSFATPALAYGAYSYGYGRKRRHGSKHGTVAQDASLPVPAAGNGVNEMVVQKYPRSVIAEAYRTIRTGVLLSSADNPPQVVVFTSGAAGEGKTVTAVNQAITLAQSGGRVLLIDADIRKPRVHRIFKLANGHGLSTYLTGQSPLESVIYEVSVSGLAKEADEAAELAAAESCVSGGRLFVLPSGPMPPNPAELVGSLRMRETIESLRGQYDYILIDTPPVLPVTDGVLLATMSDGVVLVVRGQATPVDVAQKSRDRLAYARAKVIGVVLNDVDVTSGDYYRYHRYYYSYYSENPTHGS